MILATHHDPLYHGLAAIGLAQRLALTRIICHIDSLTLSHVGERLAMPPKLPFGPGPVP